MEELNPALDYHAQTTRCGLMVEYLLIADVNDRDSDADALAAFCRERNVAAVAAGGTAGAGGDVADDLGSEFWRGWCEGEAEAADGPLAPAVIVGHIDTPERSNEPIHADATRTSSGDQASLGTTICCHRRRAGDDIKQSRSPTVSRWERLVRKARKVRRLQLYVGHIGQTLQTYGLSFRT